MRDKIRVGVFGGTGYTGGELCRLLVNHPHVREILPTSREDVEFDRVHQNLAGSGLRFLRPEQLTGRLDELDVVFFCLPSGQAMTLTPKALEEEAKVIDLGADFRFKDAEKYEEVYGRKHTCPELLEQAVYGVTEFNREQVRQARLIANPGCYVITTLLGLFPLLKNRLIELSHIPINATNGTTGGKGIVHTTAFGNVLSYNMEGHRHSSEWYCCRYCVLLAQWRQF